MKTNILIFPGGAENALEIYDSLRYNLHFNLFGASSQTDFAELLYPKDRYFVGNFNIADKHFIDNFNRIIDENHISFVIPTHDTIAVFLKTNEDKLNAKIVSSPSETALIAREKNKTYEALQKFDFIPNYVTKVSEISKFPVFAKPNIGQGGKGAKKLENKEEAQLFTQLNNIQDEEYVFCEYLPGDEYTIDCFTDRHGSLRFAGARIRQRVTMGISFSSTSVQNNEEINKIAEQINSTLEIRGAWFFQLKRAKNNNLKLLEISIRQAGTMSLYRQLGINFALLSLFDQMNLDIEILENNYPIQLERRLQTRYKIEINYESIFIDYDDTIIVNDKINIDAMSFLYQAKNQGKKIYLITKHAYDLNSSMKKHAIPNELFDEIIHIGVDDQKYRYIENKKGAIFIDNYYKERKEIKEKLGIPVFDVDAIPSLLKN